VSLPYPRAGVLQRKRAAICLLAMLFNYRLLPYVAQPAWQRASESEEALEHGESVAPYFGIAFLDVGQLFRSSQPSAGFFVLYSGSRAP
jgi:hypothetical protein